MRRSRREIEREVGDLSNSGRNSRAADWRAYINEEITYEEFRRRGRGVDL